MRVAVESNVSPRVILYDVNDASSSILDTLGIRPLVTIETRDGKVVASYGEASAKNYALAAVYVVAALVAVVFVGAAVSRALR